MPQIPARRSEVLPLPAGNWDDLNDFLAVAHNPDGSLVGTYAGVGDAQTVSDGAIGSGLTALTSASGLFKASDVGKTVIVLGAGTAGDDLRTTIAAFVSTTTVTVALAAGGTVSGVNVSWGTDNKTAIDNALAALVPISVSGRLAGGGTLVFGRGSYLTSGSHTWPLLVEIVGQGAQATNIIHTGNNACFTQSGAVLVTYGQLGMAGMTLWGNNGASAVGVEIQGKQWAPYFRNVYITAYTNGRGLLLNNSAAGAFVEGVTLDGTTLRYNKIGVELRRTLGDTSFAYQRWTDFNVHVPANGIGILIGDGAASTGTCLVYAGEFVGNIWLEGNNAIAVQIGQFGLVDNNTNWRIKGELIPNGYTNTKALRLDTGAVFYPHGIHDLAVTLTATQPTMDVVSGTYRPPTRNDEKLADQGLVRESFPRDCGIQGANAPGVGVEMATLVAFRRGDVVSGIALGVSANGVSLTLSKVAIWDKSGTLLASSGDDSANYNAGTTPRTQKTALSAPFTIPADGSYYVGYLFVGATAPTLIRGTNLGAAAVAVGSGVLPYMQSAGGKTDVGSTSVNTTGIAYWAGVY